MAAFDAADDSETNYVRRVVGAILIAEGLHELRLMRKGMASG